MAGPFGLGGGVYASIGSVNIEFFIFKPLSDHCEGFFVI